MENVRLTQNKKYHLYLIFGIAVPVVCPTMVLNAKLTIVAILTPLLLVRVSNISAGIIQLNGPHVAENEKLYSQVMAINPQDAARLLLVSAGYLASRMVAMTKVTIFPRFPNIRGQRRPRRSMKSMQRNWPKRAIMEL